MAQDYGWAKRVGETHQKLSKLPLESRFQTEVASKDIMNYSVYILECADGSLYVGCTNDLEKRIKQHNESKWGAHYTKIRRPVILKYSEEFKTLKEARQRESEIKNWKREKKFTLINSK